MSNPNYPDLQELKDFRDNSHKFVTKADANFRLMTVSVKSMKEENTKSNVRKQIRELIKIHNKHVKNLKGYLGSISDSYQDFIVASVKPVKDLKINIDITVSQSKRVNYDKYVNRIHGTVDDFYNKSSNHLGLKKIIDKYNKFSAHIERREGEEGLEKHQRKIIAGMYAYTKLYNNSTELPIFFYNFVVLHHNEISKLLHETFPIIVANELEEIDLDDDDAKHKE